MKTLLKLFLPLFALCCVSTPAHADTLLYTNSGTFAGNSWSFAFEAAGNPAILESGNGGFNFAFSDFSASVDGSTLAITPTFIRFFSSANGGGFAICFTGTSVATCSDGLITPFGNPQMYKGTTSVPTSLTLFPGAFALNGLDLVVNSNVYDLGPTTVQASPFPNPRLC